MRFGSSFVRETFHFILEPKWRHLLIVMIDSLFLRAWLKRCIIVRFILALYMINFGTGYIPGWFCVPLYPLDVVSTLGNMAACCKSVKREIVLDWVGKHVDIYWNHWAMMKFHNETGLVNFVCTVVELGNKVLALSSTENPIVQWYLPLGAFPRANFSYDLFFT